VAFGFVQRLTEIRPAFDVLPQVPFQHLLEAEALASLGLGGECFKPLGDVVCTRTFRTFAMVNFLTYTASVTYDTTSNKSNHFARFIEGH